jgi:hypothetical protein
MFKFVELMINNFLEEEIYDIEILVTESNGFQYRINEKINYKSYVRYHHEDVSNRDVIDLTNTLIRNVRGNGRGEFKKNPLTLENIINKKEYIMECGFPIIINRKLILINFEATVNDKNMLQTKINIRAYDRYSVK